MKSAIILAALLIPTAAMAQMSSAPYGTQVPRIHSPQPLPLPQAPPMPQMPQAAPLPQLTPMPAPPVCQNVCGPYGCQMVCY